MEKFGALRFNIGVMILPAIFSLIVGAAGWFYLFYSHAAARLAAVESPARNRRRVILRRIGGCSMILLAILFYIGFVFAQRDDLVRAAGCMLGVFILMMIVLTLALYDLRMTRAVHRSQRERNS